jgi:Tol biopolymer transport system component
MKTPIATWAGRTSVACVLGLAATVASGTVVGSASGIAGTVVEPTTSTAGCDGGRIVFMREGGGPPVMYAMSAQGRGLTSLGIGHAPDLSPDGRWIAFDDGQHIRIMHPDGTGLRDLTPTLANVSSYDPSWSPGGRWIAFTSEPEGTRAAALWLVRSDGSGLHELVNAPGEEEHPSWSPDGSRIVFDSFPPAGPDHLYTVRFDGSGLEQITSDALDAWGPSWSSQNVIAFADGSSNATSDIFTMQPDGSHLRQLTNAPQGITIALPSFSPNGANITFTRFNKSFTGSEIYRMAASGQNTRELTRGQPGINLFSQWGTCG